MASLDLMLTIEREFHRLALAHKGQVEAKMSPPMENLAEFKDEER